MISGQSLLIRGRRGALIALVCSLSLAGCDDSSRESPEEEREAEADVAYLPAFADGAGIDGGVKSAAAPAERDGAAARDAGTGTQVLDLPKSGKDIVRATVTANGTGCPSGAHSTLSSDGKTFTTTFEHYQAEVVPDLFADVKDCQLAIAVRGAQADVQYAVEAYTLEGRVDLGPGVGAAISGSYYFQGNPSKGSATPLEIKGPHQGTFKLDGKVDANERIWSPCTADRDINLVTRLRLENSSPGKTGKLVASKSVLKVTQRSCK